MAKINKEHILAIPVLLIGIACAIYSYTLSQESIAYKDINSKIKQQLAFKNVMEEFFKEITISQNYINNSTDLDALKIQIEKTDASISVIKNKYKDNNNIKQLDIFKKELIQARSKIENYKKMTIQNSFTDFLDLIEGINESILENYRIIYKNSISNDINAYITALNTIYMQLKNINKNNSLIQSQLQSDDNIELELLRNKIKIEPIDNLDAAILSAKLLDINNAQSINLDNFNDLDIQLEEKEFQLYNSQTVNIKRNLFDIYWLEIKQYIMLANISSIIEKSLQLQSIEHYKNVENKILISSGLFFLFLYIAYLIFKNLQALRKIKTHTLSIIDVNYQDQDYNTILKAIIDLKNKNTAKQASLDRINIFNNIKNTYLKKLSKKYQQISKQNLNSIEFLRKTLHENEQTKALNILEENLNMTLFNFDAIFSIIGIQENDLNILDVSFNPQMTFENAINSVIDEIKSKNLDFICYIDPLLQNYLVGDEAKIKIIISNLLLSAIASASKDSKVRIAIKSISDIKDQESISISVNIKTFENIKLQSNIIEESKKLRIDIASTLLKMMHSELSIKNGELFDATFSIKFKIGDPLNLPYLNKNLKIAYMEDLTNEYNEAIDLIFKKLNLNYETINPKSKKAKDSNYDIIFTRSYNTIQDDTKNIFLLQDPLYPNLIANAILQYDKKTEKDTFILKRPKILILDENNLSLSMTKSAFENFDIELFGLSDTRLLISTINKNSFDIIFIDTDISSLNPISLAKLCKSNEIDNKLEHITTIAIISNTSNISTDDIDTSSFDGWIKKPISQKNLHKILSKSIQNFDIFIKKRNNFKVSSKILIYKKTKVQNQIYQGALNDYKDQIVLVNDFKDFKKELKSSDYRIAMIDDDSADFNLEKTITIIKSSRDIFSVNTQLFIFSNSNLEVPKEFVKVFAHELSKTQILEAVKKELNSDIGGGGG